MEFSNKDSLMNFIYSLVLLFISSSTFAAPEMVPLPIGAFTYQGLFNVAKVRYAEIVDHRNPEGQEKIKELKKSGYSCLRNKPVSTKCWFDKYPNRMYPELINTIRGAIGGIEFEFPLEYKNIDQPYDGATTQEWIIRDPYKINNKNYSLLTLVHNLEGRWFLSFPVSDVQPIAMLNYLSSQKLSLPLVVNSRVDNKITSYFVDAYLQN